MKLNNNIVMSELWGLHRCISKTVEGRKTSFLYWYPALYAGMSFFTLLQPGIIVVSTINANALESWILLHEQQMIGISLKCFSLLAPDEDQNDSHSKTREERRELRFVISSRPRGGRNIYEFQVICLRRVYTYDLKAVRIDSGKLQLFGWKAVEKGSLHESDGYQSTNDVSFLPLESFLCSNAEPS